MIAPARVIESSFAESRLPTGRIPDDAARLVAGLLLAIAERSEAEGAGDQDQTEKKDGWNEHSTT
jgi:hypothetical protein